MRISDWSSDVCSSDLSDIRKLVSFGTRHTLSDTKSDTRGIGAARRWIHAEFERISAQCGGCLEVIDVAGTISGEERIHEPTEVVSVLRSEERRVGTEGVNTCRYRCAPFP